MEGISLTQINIKREDLTSAQLQIATELNNTIKDVEDMERKAYISVDPRAISEVLMVLAVYQARIGALLPDLEYEYNKIVDEGEVLEQNAWKQNHEEARSAAACTKLSEGVYTAEWRKRKRIARWLHEKGKYFFSCTEKMIYSTNRKNDNLQAEFRHAKFQT